MRSSSFPIRSFRLGLQPAPAWTAILALVFFSLVCIVAGAGSVLRFTFPVGAFAVGLLLYFRYPILYIGFTWWMWFLTPFVARVVDLRSGWDPQRLMIVSAFLVTLITFITFLRHLPKSYKQGGLPFILAFTAVFYGFLIGVINNSPVPAARALLDWLTPLLFGFHLFVNWRDYPKISQNIRRTFLWSLLVTGSYGIVQYLVAPEWDRFWIIKTELVTNGTPEPLGIRVFSTMHSPGPFAAVMLAGILLLFNSSGVLRIPASVVGYLAFLLTLVRSAWGGWFVGLLTLLTSVKTRLQIRLMITILVMVLLVVPLATVEPFSEIIGSRFATLTNIKKDASFGERSANYSNQLELALSKGLGNGMGSTYFVNEKGVLEQIVFDSGILDMFFTLGWFGAIFYLTGIILFGYTLFQSSECRFDSFASAARAISVGMFAQLPLGSVMLGLGGLVFWGFIAMSMAACKYYRQAGAARSNSR